MSEVLRLALPVTVGFLGLQTMNLVDLLAVGRVGASAIGAVGLGTAVFSWLMMMGIGVLLGLDYFVSHSFGAGKKADAFHSFVQGIWISILATIPLQAVMLVFSFHMDWLTTEPEVARQAGPYLRALSFSLFPNLAFVACRQYLQGFGIVKVTTWVMIVANAVNALFNYLLVFGHAGFPALGAVGAGWSTLVSRLWMIGALAVYIGWWDRREHRFLGSESLRFDSRRALELLKLGVPAALQLVLEVGVFALATALAARLTANELAAHQVALNLASITFMVPLGIGSATATLVGQARGRGEPSFAIRQGWRGFALGVGFMAFSCLAFLLFPEPILRFYTTDSAVIETGAKVLFLAGIFQLADGTQVVGTGALRGMGDTRTPMVANFLGHWLLGLPLGLYLCFKLQWRLAGLWAGLCVGLIAVAAALLLKWVVEARRHSPGNLIGGLPASAGP